eukprot:CAMPEP_0175063628 /NCGR_PEP_ID=MMETSP0052_2-20121109/14869_1 /TAXON_ID=51329 ORGANISM="Polytomella parva, Strain SAG 63-3" /NCGR_SAMPLE_ID=MMETSP0052_2 /ASSEMBLY_ACC=CAM_ASM_000194 /LENGTH=346 /DNA_ID=CAMNT_0016329861 /DNA_START=22 /DNA_END=1059 /DNA_ORIENTATION=-
MSFDTIFAIGVEELGLEGREGCSPTRWFQLIEDKRPFGNEGKLPLLIRSFLWRSILSRPNDFKLALLGSATSDKSPKKDAGSAKSPKRSKNNDSEPELILIEPTDERVQSLEGGEKMGIRIIPSEEIRLSVLRVFEGKEGRFQISAIQLLALELIGRQRWKGAIQSELSAKLKLQPRNFFYVVKSLEVRGLIVKNPVMVPSLGNPNLGHSGPVATSNIIHLIRFAPPVRLQPGQVFKMVSVPGATGSGTGISTYMLHDDSLHMKLICDVIAETEERMVVESELKIVCGFRGKRGHRNWRRLRSKLLDLKYIETILARHHGKPVTCVRLLRPYDSTSGGGGGGGKGG